jgi:glycosyltransferase involved in cell wall biosynthesis
VTTKSASPGEQAAARRQPAEGIVLVVPYSEFAVLPSIANAAHLLADAGYQVDMVATTSQRFLNVPPHDFGTDRVRVTLSDPGRPGRLKGVGWLLAIPRLAATALRVCRATRPRWLFGIDADGLIAASWVGRRLGLPVVYYSLEIELAAGEWRQLLDALRSRHSPLPVLFKRFLRGRVSALLKKPLERRAHRRAAFTIALDEVRAQALLVDNHVPGAETVIVPTSPLGLTRTPDRDYLRRRFGLDPGRLILLQIGGISDVARSLELAQAARVWPPNWTLVLHGFGADPDYLTRLRTLADGRRVVLSTDMVPYAELDDLVASADLGLAMYRPLDLNHVHMASGKLLHYLKCGVPVIATAFPSLQRILHDHGCGVCVADEAGIVPAATRILADRGSWAANAAHCFRELFDFKVHFARVLDRLGQP